MSSVSDINAVPPLDVIDDPRTAGGWCPAYTSSFDTARTLVPDGVNWYVYRMASPSGPVCAAAVGGGAISEGATEIIALCIAALKYHQSVSMPFHRFDGAAFQKTRK